MRALRIFHADSHPSLMGLGGRKEGFSLLALLDRCATAMVRYCITLRDGSVYDSASVTICSRMCASI